MKILFVLGSGVSFGACPDTKLITDEVLNGNSKPPHLWRFDSLHAMNEKTCVQEFLKLLKAEVLRSKDSCTYEDLYSISLRLTNHESGYEPAPEIMRFRDYIYRDSFAFYQFYQASGHASPLAAISSSACYFITETVRLMLCEPKEDTVNLSLITDAIDHLGPDNVDVITLNHDLLLERTLAKSKLPWTDGFENQNLKHENRVEFLPEKLRDASRTRVLKIHGSLNWFYAGSNELGWKCWKIPKPSEIDPNDQISKDYETSQFLTGSTTKALAYTKGTFGAIHCAACRLLEESPIIICSGYGWKDLPFNEMLRDWSKYHQAPRMWLLHDEDRIKEFEGNKKPFFWPNDWKSDESNSWLKWHPKFLGDTNWEDLAQKIRRSK
jgi:hypothetical protein